VGIVDLTVDGVAVTDAGRAALSAAGIELDGPRRSKLRNVTACANRGLPFVATSTTPPFSDNSTSRRADRSSDPTPNDRSAARLPPRAPPVYGKSPMQRLSVARRNRGERFLVISDVIQRQHEPLDPPQIKNRV
jgi:hypothetical protein